MWLCAGADTRSLVRAYELGFVFRSLADRPLNLVELAARLQISSQGALKIVTERPHGRSDGLSLRATPR